jgi:hypothetical protein
MLANQALQELVEQKLNAFEQLEPAFEESFLFVQQAHGQQRFTSFPVASTVHYLHALWICECKDRLLSIYKNIERYEGSYCLELLRRWQEGETADVVDFLHRKLDMLPFSDLEWQIHSARQQHLDEGLVRRLVDGRSTLLNRGINLMQAFDAIFTLSEEQLMSEVLASCERYGHRPEEIELQLARFETPLYAFVSSQALARRNIEEMNKLGVLIMSKPSDQPGARSERVLQPTILPLSFAEQVIEGYIELSSPRHNNLRRVRLVDFRGWSGTSAI